jgi:hypothetical protein
MRTTPRMASRTYVSADRTAIPELLEEPMNTSRRTAGLGLLAYGIGTPVAFMTIGAPGGDYEDSIVTSYIAGGHRATAFALAYLGVFATLGLLPFASRMRSELRSGGEIFWGLTVGGTAASVIGWFLLGGIPVVFGEGGSALAGLPHDVVYALSELGILVTVGAGSFLVGAGALVMGARASLPGALRVACLAGGVCGILAAFFFPLFLFWLWAIGFGMWMAVAGAREGQPVVARHQPV